MNNIKMSMSIKLNNVNTISLSFVFDLFEKNKKSMIRKESFDFNKQSFMFNVYKKNYETNDLHLKAIEIDGTEVGAVGLSIIKEKRANLFVIIDDKNQKKGVATGALSLLIKEAVQELNINEFIINTEINNKSMRRVAEKLNFKLLNIDKKRNEVNYIYTTPGTMFV